jgi:hypothetical protein
MFTKEGAESCAKCQHQVIHTNQLAEIATLESCIVTDTFTIYLLEKGVYSATGLNQRASTLKMNDCRHAHD